MSILTMAQLTKMCVGKPNASNAKSFLLALNAYGEKNGLADRANLAHYIAQVLHESGCFRYDKEIWGPTPAQKRYDTRTDLGNTKARDGDGKLYMGRTPMQITGKSNYEQFTAWAKQQDSTAPDFVKNPDAANTDPWEGLGPMWYWSSRKLNKYAADNNIIMVTKVINGGLNGFDDRLRYYGRAALVLAGYGITKAEIKRFQADHKLQVDGIIGDQTRMALHKALKGANPYTEEVKTPVPVLVDDANKSVLKTLEGNKEVVTTVAVPAVTGLLGAPWQTVIAIGAVMVLGFVVFLIIRRMKAKEQTAAVNRIEELAAA